MKFTILFVFFAGLFFGQTQAGSVAIADTIVSASEVVVDNFTTCVEKLSKVSGLQAEKVVSACKDVSNIAHKTATRLANEAADATKASRPVVVDGWGSSGYGGGWGGGYYRSPGIIISRGERAAANRQARTERAAANRQARTERATLRRVRN